jgi:predicted nucleic acid-binding protein
MIIPRQVYNEISTVPHLHQKIDVMVNNGNLTIEDLLVGSEENKLYLDLTDYTRSGTLPLIGKGEAAAIVLSKKNNGILASNNFRDVRYYVELYGLNHISTPDIIYKAFNDGLISITEADSIWIQMVTKRRKLPFRTFSEYINSL